jgi:hypothetical protein
MRALMLLALPFAIAIVGCGTGTHSRESFDRQYPYARHPIFGKAERDRALSKLRAQIGGQADSKVRVRFFTMWEGYLALQAQDPRRKDHLDDYTYRDGGVDDPRPVKLSDDEEAKVIGSLFDLDDVPFDRMPQLMQKALQEMDLEGGHVTRFGATDNPEHGFTMNVAVEGDRKSGSVTFDPKGNVLRVDR